MTEQIKHLKLEKESLRLDITSPLGSKLVGAGCFGGVLATFLLFASGNDDILGWNIPYGYTIGVIIVTILCLVTFNYLDEKIILDFVGKSVKFERRLFGVMLQSRLMANFADLRSVVLHPRRVAQIGKPASWHYGISLLTIDGVLIPIRVPFYEDYKEESEYAANFASLLGITLETGKPKAILKVRTQLGTAVVDFEPHPDDRNRPQDP